MHLDLNDKNCHNVGNRGYLGITMPFGIFGQMGQDCDGDTIAVHGIISEESEAEAEYLMNPINNQRGVADGRYTAGPEHEILAGVAYATSVGFHGDSVIISRNVDDVIRQFETGRIKINTPVDWRGDLRRITCAGRLILEELSNKIIHGILDKRGVGKYLSELHEEIGPEKCAEFGSAMQSVGAEIITMFGPSISLSDFSDEKFDKIRDEAITDLKIAVSKLNALGEKHDLVQTTIDGLYDLWKSGDSQNTLRFFANYASRLSPIQIRQLVIARGVQMKVGGGSIPMPLYNTLRDQSPIEFFAGVRGARAALVAKISITPEAGYLTRRMVSAARDIYITETDCGTSKTVYMEDTCGHYVGEEMSRGGSGEARSIITCESRGGFCAKCYGEWKQDGNRVKTGTAVGVVASQSLSERTIQASMKVKHLAGMREGSDDTVGVYAPCSGVLKCAETHLSIGEYDYPFQRLRTTLLVESFEEVEKGQIVAFVIPPELSTTKKVDKYLEASKSAPETIAPIDGKMTRKGQTILVDGEPVGIWDKETVFRLWDGERVKAGDRISEGHKDVLGMIDRGEISEAYKTLIEELRKILGKDISQQHIETMIRAVVEIGFDDNNLPLYRRDRPDLPIQLTGMTRGSARSPRTLRSLGFGHVRAILEESILRESEGHSVPAEAIQMGHHLGDIRG